MPDEDVIALLDAGAKVMRLRVELAEAVLEYAEKFGERHPSIANAILALKAADDLEQEKRTAKMAGIMESMIREEQGR